MEIARLFRNGNVLFISLLFTLHGLSISSLCHAELPAGVVPITSEPSHKVLFENKKVRIIEARIAKGTKSLFHEHRFDGFYAFFKTEGFFNEPYLEKPISPNLQAGAVMFIPAIKPYIHRVGAAGKEDVHVSVVELLTPTLDVTNVPEARFPPFEISLENSRGRIYRLKLNPGESTDVFMRPAGTTIFAISSGQISEKTEGKPVSSWALTPGKFRWADTSEALTINNTGKVQVELVEIEVF